MSKEPEIKEEDQANELRQLFQDVEREQEIELENENQEKERPEEQKIDVLNLPPRKEVHKKQKLIKLKMSRAFIRLLMIALILLIGLGAAIYTWQGEIASLLDKL